MFYLEFLKGVYKINSFKIESSGVYSYGKTYKITVSRSSGENLCLVSDRSFSEIEAIYNKLKECIGKNAIINFKDLIY